MTLTTDWPKECGMNNKQRALNPNIHITAEQAQALRPLMWRPCPPGDTRVGPGIEQGNPKYALCISCGAKSYQAYDLAVALRSDKHKCGCPYIAWCKAL